jgi:hypothetical protein
MENSELAGPGTPQGTVFAEYDFVAVDINLPVGALLEMGAAAVEMRDYFESLAEPVGSLKDLAAVYPEEVAPTLTTDVFLELMAEPGESREETIERLSIPIEKRQWFVEALAIRRARNRLRKAEKRFAWRGMAARTLKPVSFIMPWLDLIGRLRKATSSAPCSTLSFPSCGGWTS